MFKDEESQASPSSEKKKSGKNKSKSKINSTNNDRKLKNPKPKYYIQIASVFLRQRKENGEFVDMDPKYYKSWNDEPWYFLFLLFMFYFLFF